MAPLIHVAVLAFAALSVAALASCTVHAAALTLPPWRGPRQLLSVGPWGVLFDSARLRYSDASAAALLVSADGTSRLVPSPTDLPLRPDGHRRIVAISDTHGKHRSLSVPPCDVLCHCGDILQRYGYLGDLGGGIPALLDFASWLRNDVPAERGSVVIGGNHDRLLEKLGDKTVRSILSRKGGDATYLCNESANVAGLVFYGSPWSPEGGTGNRAFQRGSDATVEAARALRSTRSRGSPDAPRGDEGGRIDVLLTHAADSAWEAVTKGEAGPMLWAHGHWHDGQGRVAIVGGRCVSVNVASNDMIYRPRNPPVVFDVPHGD